MFPIINNIDDVLWAIEGRDEFVVTYKDSYIVINYHVQFADTFDSGIPEVDAIRKECRGIIFDANSKDIIRRPYHKFFNLGEKPETSIEFVAERMNERDNLGYPKYGILPKLDGSMIAPFLAISGANVKLIWGTKMGETDISKQVSDFLDRAFRHNTIICDWVIRRIEDGYTPIFEWCSPQNRIVVDYKTERLILTAMRNIRNGEYISPAAFEIPNGIDICHARLGLPDKIDDLVTHTRGLLGEEGFVLRFKDGHMVKIKADEYVRIHKAKDTLVHEKNVLQCVLSNSDDDLIALLPKEDSDKLRTYSEEVKRGLQEVANEIQVIYENFKQENINPSKKDFALHVMGNHTALAPILFKVWDGHDAFQTLLNYCLKFTSSGTKVETIRPLIKARWNYQEKE